MDPQRRFWLLATGATGCIGCAATAVPFIESMDPSAAARAEGGPIKVDFTGLEPGQRKTVLWRGQPIGILHRTPAMLVSLNVTQSRVVDPLSQSTQYPTPEWARNQWRSTKPEYFIWTDICTHLGCSPTDRLNPGPQPGLPSDWVGGFLCPCHGSTYDLAARVFKNMPAPGNMAIPDYHFVRPTEILLGVPPHGS
uniref:Ubiquinol-cytochrome c reductase iron-sulfur subunit n=1 Tax=mine drainage metagenome TaxID=410659 RepID=E6PKG8_9ZZZZ